MAKSNRSRIGIGAATLAGLCLAALPAAAQQEHNVTTSKDRGETVKVTVTGDVVLDYVYRGREMTGYTDSQGAFTAANSRSENTFEGYVAARLAIDLSDQVSAVVEFGTKRIDGNAILRWGQATATGIDLREAAVLLTDFLLQDMKTQLGITNWSFDVRGKGSAFAFDPRHSQSLNRNLAQVGALAVEETGNGRLAMANFPEELEAVGATFTYSRNNLAFDLVVLPAVIEGGTPSGDEALYALDGWYRLDDKGSKIGVIVACSTPGGNSHGRIFTIGVGADLKKLADGLEVYLEGYLQAGKSGEDATGGDVHAKGKALQLGAEYRLQNDHDIWFGLNLTYLSGDGDNAAGGNGNTDRFVSYENVNDLMILEDQYFGFDWDSNYVAVKLMGGVSFSVGSGKNNLDLSAILGLARAAEDVTWTTGTVAGETSRKLGTEVDVKARWHLNKQASLTLGIAALFGSTILENSMVADGASSSQSAASTFLYTLGIDLRF